MKGMKGRSVFILFVLATILAGSVSLSAEVIPRVTNFVILVDQSGSMFQQHAKRVKVKASLAKAILLEMNERIPELGYDGAIITFSPERRLIGPEEYDRFFFKRAIEGLAESGEVVENLTPLGPAILNLKKILPRFPGKTAVIIISDGRANQGMNPIEAARKLYEEHGNTCFHVISLADNEKGRTNLEAISKLGNCIFLRGGDVLSDVALMDHFVSEVFYLEVEEEVPAQVVPSAEAPPTVLQGIRFDFDKYNIKPEWLPVLDNAVDTLLNNPKINIVIEGHTDNTGDYQYNQRLSERRAKAVYDYLVNKGVAPDRMEMVGYGETWPEISNLTPQGRAINRRVEITAAE